MKTFEEVCTVIQALNAVDIETDAILLNGDDNEITISIMCNDLFWWGTADAEKVTTEDIPLLKQCYADLNQEHLGWAALNTPELYVARKRKMRPQGAYYKYFPKEIWPLFNACGPARPSDFGNPVATPE
mgnify:CR=1 FL=1